jgi:hypothetical protein
MSYSSKKREDLKKWVLAYSETRQDKNETRSGLIKRADLESFWKYMENNSEIDGIRIYLIRSDEITNIRKLQDGRPQMSFAIVPTKDFKKGLVTDFFEKDDLIHCIIPGDGNESSGLCPPNCGDPVDG